MNNLTLCLLLWAAVFHYVLFEIFCYHNFVFSVWSTSGFLHPVEFKKVLCFWKKAPLEIVFMNCWLLDAAGLLLLQALRNGFKRNPGSCRFWLIFSVSIADYWVFHWRSEQKVKFRNEFNWLMCCWVLVTFVCFAPTPPCRSCESPMPRTHLFPLGAFGGHSHLSGSSPWTLHCTLRSLHLLAWFSAPSLHKRAHLDPQSASSLGEGQRESLAALDVDLQPLQHGSVGDLSDAGQQSHHDASTLTGKWLCRSVR